MVFEVEFITTDVRSLYYGGDENLISFLGPLHRNNQTIVSYANLSYLRQLGKVNTTQKHGRTYFQVQNRSKFPSFNTHHNEIIKNKLYYIRKNHLRRFLTTEAYGVINRLKIGFDFSLSRNNTTPLPIKPTKQDKEEYSQNETFLILQNLLHITTIVGKGTHAQNLPLNKLGKWTAEAIERATHVQKEKFQKEDFKFIPWIKDKVGKILNDKKERQFDVEHVGTVAIVSFFADEKVAIPSNAHKFPTPPLQEKEDIEQCITKKKAKEPHKNLDIFYYDYIVKNNKKDYEDEPDVDTNENPNNIRPINDQQIDREENEIVRVYFIK